MEPPPGHRFDALQRPPLIFPAVRGRPLGQLRLQLSELLLAQPRQRRRALRPKSPKAALGPHAPPPLHRPHADTQLLRDRRASLTPREPIRCPQPQLLAELLPFSGQPAPLWIPHAPVIPQETTARQSHDSTSSTSVTTAQKNRSATPLRRSPPWTRGGTHPGPTPGTAPGSNTAPRSAVTNPSPTHSNGGPTPNVVDGAPSTPTNNNSSPTSLNRPNTARALGLRSRLHLVCCTLTARRGHAACRGRVSGKSSRIWKTSRKRCPVMPAVTARPPHGCGCSRARSRCGTAGGCDGCLLPSCGHRSRRGIRRCGNRCCGSSPRSRRARQ